MGRCRAGTRPGGTGGALWSQPRRGCGGPSEALVEVLDHFLQGGCDALGLVVGRDDDAHGDFGGLDVSEVWHGEAGGDGRVRLEMEALGAPAVVPAWELSSG